MPAAECRIVSDILGAVCNPIPYQEPRNEERVGG